MDVVRKISQGQKELYVYSTNESIKTKHFFGGDEGWRGRRSLVMRGLSVILTLQPKFLDRFRSYVDL